MIDLTSTDYLPLVGVILSFAIPLAYSIWVETRFVHRWAAAVYGGASLSFAVSFYSLGISEIGMWALGIFLVLGFLFIGIATINRNIWHGASSIIFSYKTIAGFQLGFLFLAFFPTIFDELPQMAQMPLLNIVIWGLFLTMMLHSTIAPVRYIKN